MKDRNYRQPLQSRPVEVHAEPERVTPVRQRRVKPHRWCPACSEGYGVANGRYETAQSVDRRYYKCNHCGHSWSYRIPLDVRGDFPQPSEEAT